MDGFPFSTELSVRFAETDAQGVAHNASYIVWFEVARVEYLREFAGGYQTLRDQGLEALVLETQIRYRSPARFDDRLRVHARVRDVRGARFRYEYVIARDSETLADGSTSHACVDAQTFRPVRIPQWLVDAITAAESSSSSAASSASSSP